MTAVSDPTGPPIDFATMETAELVRTHQAGIWRYLRFLGAKGAEADDLAQETFLAALRKPFEQRSDSETAAYLRTVARNQLLMLRRKQQRQIRTVELETAEAVWSQWAGPTGTLDSYLDRLESCLEQLSDRSRQAIDLKYRENSSRVEIARQLDMKPNGIKTLLRRARQILRECVERQMAKENQQ